MPLTPHVEQHFTSSEYVRDIVFGMSDVIAEIIVKMGLKKLPL